MAVPLLRLTAVVILMLILMNRWIVMAVVLRRLHGLAAINDCVVAALLSLDSDRILTLCFMRELALGAMAIILALDLDMIHLQGYWLLLWNRYCLDGIVIYLLIVELACYRHWLLPRLLSVSITRPATTALPAREADGEFLSGPLECRVDSTLCSSENCRLIWVGCAGEYCFDLPLLLGGTNKYAN